MCIRDSVIIIYLIITVLRVMSLNFSGELTEEHKKEMEKHGAFSQDKIAEHYDELSSHYEEIYLRAGWHDPLKCAELAK